MAKENPYFKFFCSEWNDGDITLCSLEAQGLFINLCSLYWSKQGPLKVRKIERRFNADQELSELIDEGIVEYSKVDEEPYIRIKFLDEQIGERAKQSKQASNAAKKRWQSEDNTTAMRPHKSTYANKIREDKIREEKNVLDSFKTKLRDDIAIFFKITEMNQPRQWFKLTALVNNVKNTYLRTQFEGYKEEKSDGKYLHSIDKWIGDPPEFEGIWKAKEYETKVKGFKIKKA